MASHEWSAQLPLPQAPKANEFVPLNSYEYVGMGYCTIDYVAGNDENLPIASTMVREAPVECRRRCDRERWCSFISSSTYGACSRYGHDALGCTSRLRPDTHVSWRKVLAPPSACKPSQTILIDADWRGWTCVDDAQRAAREASDPHSSPAISATTGRSLPHLSLIHI